MTVEVLVVSGLAIASFGAIAASYHDTKSVRDSLAKVMGASHVHQLLSAVIIVAHASEIGRVVSHLTWVHALVAITLFAVWMFSRTASETDIA